MSALSNEQIAQRARERIKKLGMTFSVQWDKDVDEIIVNAIETAWVHDLIRETQPVPDGQQ